MTNRTKKGFNATDTKFGVISARYSHKQFSTCSKLLISTDKELEKTIFLRECTSKLPINGGLGYI